MGNSPYNSMDASAIVFFILGFYWCLLNSGSGSVGVNVVTKPQIGANAISVLDDSVYIIEQNLT